MSLEHRKIVITSPQSKVKGRKLSTILFRRRLQILGVSGVVMSVASVLALSAKPTYQSTIQILVKSKLNEGVRSSHTQQEAESNFTNTNLDIINDMTQQKLMLSSNLIQKAVNLLRFEYTQSRIHTAPEVVRRLLRVCQILFTPLSFHNSNQEIHQLARLRQST